MAKENEYYLMTEDIFDEPIIITKEEHKAQEEIAKILDKKYNFNPDNEEPNNPTDFVTEYFKPGQVKYVD